MNVSYLKKQGRVDRAGIEVYFTLAEIRPFFCAGARHEDYIMYRDGPPPKFYLYGKLSKTSDKKIRFEITNKDQGNLLDFDYNKPTPYEDNDIVCHVRITARKFWGKNSKRSKKFYAASPTTGVWKGWGYIVKWPKLCDRIAVAPRAPRKTKELDVVTVMLTPETVRDLLVENTDSSVPAPALPDRPCLSTLWAEIQKQMASSNKSFSLELPTGERVLLTGAERLLEACVIFVPVQ